MAQQAARVLVRTALPWAVRIGKEDAPPGLDGEPRVVGQLLAPISGLIAPPASQWQTCPGR